MFHTCREALEGHRAVEELNELAPDRVGHLVLQAKVRREQAYRVEQQSLGIAGRRGLCGVCVCVLESVCARARVRAPRRAAQRVYVYGMGHGCVLVGPMVGHHERMSYGCTSRSAPAARARAASASDLRAGAYDGGSEALMTPSSRERVARCIRLSAVGRVWVPVPDPTARACSRRRDVFFF